MKKIELTQGKLTLVDNADFDWLNQWKWHIKNSRGKLYASRTSKGILMHRIILGITDKNIECDHIDGNGLNNQRKNLRIATRAQNARNTKGFGRSKYRGVYKKTANNGANHYWAVKIIHEGKTHYPGQFPFNKKGEKQAALLYNEKAKELHGNFAFTNKI